MNLEYPIKLDVRFSILSGKTSVLKFFEIKENEDQNDCLVVKTENKTLVKGE